MLSKRNRSSRLVFAAMSSMIVSSLFISPAFAQAEPVVEKESAADTAEAKKEIGLEDMREHRQMLRENLMLPSLKGLRGISYGIPGHNPFPELDKVVAARLKQLPIPVKKIEGLKSGDTKPIDAILQLKVLAAGDRTTVVELTLTQWSQLLRDPKLHSRSITYADQAVTHNSTVNDVAGKMINQFVLDYLKANGDEKKGGKGKKG